MVGQIGLDGVISSFTQQWHSVLFFLALVVSQRSSSTSHRVKLRFTGGDWWPERFRCRFLLAASFCSRVNRPLLQADLIAGRGYAVARRAVAVLVTSPPPMGVVVRKGDLQLVPAIHISGRDGVAFAVVQEFLRADLFRRRLLRPRSVRPSSQASLTTSPTRKLPVMTGLGT